MKKLMLIFLLCPLIASAQKIVEDKVDEFTKKHVKRSSWENFGFSSGFSGYTRVEKIDGTIWLNLRFMTGGVVAMKDGAKFMLMTKTDSVITLYNNTYEISCSGCGAIGLVGSAAQGLNVSFMLPESKIVYLIQNGLKKIRLYTTDGYVEREIKEKHVKSLLRQLELVSQ